MKKVEEDEEELSWACWLRTMFFGSGAMMIFIFAGLTEGQSAVLLPQLKEKDSIIHATPDEETWIASLGILLAPISALLTGPILDMFGRKVGLLSFYVCMGLGFGTIAFASKIWHIYIGRSICGFALGMEVSAAVWLAESCAKKQRSIFLSSLSATFTVGVAIANIIGGLLPWSVASAIFALGCLVFFIVQLFSPESPAWLYKRGKTDASTRSLKKLGRSPSGITRELEMLRLSSKNQSEKFQLREFLEPTVWKPFLILTLFHFFECATGFYDIVLYTVDFIDRLGTSYDPLTISIITSIVRVVAVCTLGVYFTANVSRRHATMISAAGMAICLAGLGAWEFFYRDVPVGQKPYGFVAVGFFLGNIVSGLVAVTTLPWMMSGEVFPLRVRGSMSGAVFVTGMSIAFVFIKGYEFSLELLGVWRLLLTFAGAAFLLIPFGAFLLPETQNKTLLEIEQGFMSKDKRQNEWSRKEVRGESNKGFQSEVASGEG